MDSTDTRDNEIASFGRNIGSTNIILTTDELTKIDETVNGITLVGDRYPEVLEKQIDRS